MRGFHPRKLIVQYLKWQVHRLRELDMANEALAIHVDRAGDKFSLADIQPVYYSDGNHSVCLACADLPIL